MKYPGIQDAERELHGYFNHRKTRQAKHFVNKVFFLSINKGKVPGLYACFSS